ncbi:MAG: cysteine desulfurase [Spirochaetia bacterium]|nr:cysteine desulfurase [Spirochaetia bacterium]
MTPVYFDYNATTPVHLDILPKIQEYAQEFGNPSSLHRYGRESQKILESSRIEILKDFRGYKLIFTSSGTEANHLAFHYLRERELKSKDTILISSIEHPCIEKQMSGFQKMGYNVVRIPVLKNGIVDLNFIAENTNESTCILSVMGANNETGVVQPILEIANICRDKGIYFHCDMSQIPGKFELDVSDLDIDSITISAHKFYGLKGVGALLYKTKPLSIFHGGLQENGLRAGTENMLGIQVMGTAYNLVKQNSKEWILSLKELRDYFESHLDEKIIRVGNLPNHRIANTSCILLPNNPNDRSVLFLDSKGFLVSRGAACHSGVWEPSPVLMAMGYSREEAETGIRVSFGIYNTKSQVEELAYTLNKMVS